MQEFATELARRLIAGNPRFVRSTLFESREMRQRRGEFDRRNFGEMLAILHLNTGAILVLDKRKSVFTPTKARLMYAQDLFEKGDFARIRTGLESKNDLEWMVTEHELGSHIKFRCDRPRRELHDDGKRVNVLVFEGSLDSFFRSGLWSRVVSHFRGDLDRQNFANVINELIEEEKVFTNRRFSNRGQGR